MGQLKGHPKAGGRKKGSVNRTTSEAKQILNAILFGEMDNIKEVLDKLRMSRKDRYRYLDCLAKLLQYSLPKKTDVTSDDDVIKPPVNITVTSSKAAKQLKDFISGT